MYCKCFSRCLGNKSLQKFCDVNSDCIVEDDLVFFYFCVYFAQMVHISVEKLKAKDKRPILSGDVTTRIIHRIPGTG